MQAEEGQDCQYDNHQSDKIDDVIHMLPPSSTLNPECVAPSFGSEIRGAIGLLANGQW
jgi:hypothetical protein